MGETLFDMVNTVFGSGFTAELSEWLNKVFDSMDSVLNSGGGGISIALNTFSAIACSLLIIYFFQDLMNQASKDMFSFEKLVVMFIRMFIAFCILVYLEDILNMTILWAKGFKDIAVSIGDQISTGTLTDLGLSETAKESYKSYYKGILKTILGVTIMFRLLIPSLICFLADLMAKFLTASTAVMLIVRMIFSPMAVVQVFEEGSRSAGIRYIKGMLAEALSFAVIIVIVNVGSSFAANIVADEVGESFSLAAESLNSSLTLKSMLPLVIGKLVIVGGMASGSKIAHDIMGA